MFWKRLKNCIATIVALLIAALALLFVCAIGVVSFPQTEGTRRYYLDGAYSQEGQAYLSLFDCARVRGQSVSCRMTEVEALAFIEELGGEVLFTEEASGVRSYYCYTKAVGGGLVVGGYFVNLHVAVEGSRCVVGSPIIFGSF